MATALEQTPLVARPREVRNPPLIRVPDGPIPFEEGAIAEIDVEMARLRDNLFIRSSLNAKDSQSCVVSKANVKAAIGQSGSRPPPTKLATASAVIGSLLLAPVVNQFLPALEGGLLLAVAIVGTVLLVLGILKGTMHANT